MIDLSENAKKEILVRYNHTCQKCGFFDSTDKTVHVHIIPTQFKDRAMTLDMTTVLCTICKTFAPKHERYFNSYLKEKIDGTMLNTFRNASKSIVTKTKEGMQKNIQEGKTITRAPTGYIITDGKLVPSSESARIVSLFTEFSTTTMSLNAFAKKYALSTPGLIKLLKNKVYLGHMIVNGIEHKNTHTALISEELFSQVQNKL